MAWHADTWWDVTDDGEFLAHTGDALVVDADGVIEVVDAIVSSTLVKVPNGTFSRRIKYVGTIRAYAQNVVIP